MVSMEGYQTDLELLGPVKAFQKWELPSREKAESLLREAIEAGKNIIYDRSCALPSSYAFLQECVDRYGYTLIMHVLYVTKDVAFARAKAREEKTNRHIPQDVFLERMAGISALWLSYVELAKEAYLYDSNHASYKVIAEGKDSDITVFDEKRYESFLQQDNLPIHSELFSLKK